MQSIYLIEICVYGPRKCLVTKIEEVICNDIIKQFKNE